MKNLLLGLSAIAVVFAMAIGVPSILSAQAAPEPHRARQSTYTPRLAVDDSDLTIDTLHAYLYDYADRSADAYADRNENPDGRALRIDQFVTEIEDAVRVSDLPEQDKWKYADTLICVAHKETRLARSPKLLGNQDNGRAHGMWQIWSWHGKNPFAATTALEMLREEPFHSWSLPKVQPWTGNPDCAKWIREHPYREAYNE